MEIALPHNPIVSVLMPIYNGEPFLADAVKSILSQSYGDFELIVVDDNSTDNTPEILYQFTQLDPRISVFKQDANLGLTQSLNLGLAKVKGEFIARHDADDLSEPERFASQVDFLKRHHNYGIVGTAVTRIDSQGNKIAQPIVIRGDKRIRMFMKDGNAFVHGSIMMRKSVIDAVGGYRTGFRYAQDYDLWLRISEITRVDNLPKRLYRWRLHSAGISDIRLYDQTLYAALASYFAKERRKNGKDSYTVLENGLRENIGDLLKDAGLKKEIDPLIGRILFRFGEREIAYQLFSHANGVSNKLYSFLCRNEWLFQLARKTARFTVSLKK